MSAPSLSDRCTLVINAGGQSRRMGSAKALLPVPPHNTPLIAHMVHRLRPLDCHGVVVVTNDPTLPAAGGLDEAAIALPDRFPGAGALGGIATGLGAVHDWAIVLACDLPLISARLLRWLCSLALDEEAGVDRWDVVMPVVGGYEEPLHALYHGRCLPAMEQRLSNGERRVISFLPDVRVRYVSEEELRRVDPELTSFYNANTPEEWEQALLLLAAETR